MGYRAPSYTEKGSSGSSRTDMGFSLQVVIDKLEGLLNKLERGFAIYILVLVADLGKIMRRNCH